MGIFGVALGMVIIAAAAVFGLQMYDDLTTEQNASETQMLLVQIAADMQAAYRTEATYGAANADLTALANDLNIIPPDYQTAAATAESPFNEELAITAQGTEFDIEINDIDEEACEALMSRAWRTGELLTVAVDGNAATEPDDITAANVGAWCNDDDSDIVFRFR